MEEKLKHKTTIVDPAQILGLQVNRSQRRNKTMLKTYKSTKQQNQLEVFTNQKQIKTIVEGKIQELHRKMRDFFSQQRKNHLEQIAPDMQSLKNLIIQLRKQLNKPKSMQEIQKEKHQLFKRKNMILAQIESVNKELKGNKKEFLQKKMETQELQREVNNALATLKKYKHKMDKKTIQNHQNQNQTQKNLEIPHEKRDSENIQKILNDSLLDENNPTQSLRVSFQQNDKKQHSSSNNQNDHIHITEVYERQDPKYKLPSINNKSMFLNNYSKSSNTKNKFTQLQSHRDSRLKKKPQNQHNLISSNTNNNKSTTSFASILNPLDAVSYSNLSYSNLHSQFLYPKPKKSMPLDLSLELQKYQQHLNKSKWTEVEKLFQQYDDLDIEQKQQINKNGIKSTVNSSSSVNILSQLLMDELRKVQFASYKQKGYHQGLKDKTYQIKIELKNIFKNFSSNDFFSKAMNKKAVQKQLLKVLQNSIQG